MTRKPSTPDRIAPRRFYRALAGIGVAALVLRVIYLGPAGAQFDTAMRRPPDHAGIRDSRAAFLGRHGR